MPDPSALAEAGEHFASGYYEFPEASPMRRWSRAVRRRFENRDLEPYDGEPLYPCGPKASQGQNRAIVPDYSYTMWYHEGRLDALLDKKCRTSRVTSTGSTKNSCLRTGSGGEAGESLNARQRVPETEVDLDLDF